MGRTKPVALKRVHLDFGPMAARRRYLNVTQRQLALAVGVSRMTIFRVETNRTEPSVALLVACCQELGLPFEQLFSLMEIRADAA